MYGKEIGETIFYLKPLLDEYGFEKDYEERNGSSKIIEVIFAKTTIENPHDPDEIEISYRYNRSKVQFLPLGYSPKYSGFGQSIYSNYDIKDINQDTFFKFFGSPKKY